MSKRNQEMEKFVREILAMYNCDILYVVDGNKWYGNYGEVCYIDGYDKLQFHGDSLRSVYKAAHRIFMDTKTSQDDRLYSASWWDGALVLFNNAHQSNYDDNLFILANGQVYDAFNKYWYDIHASKLLKKWLKGGYNYTDPQTFYKDQCNDSDNKPESYYGFGGWEE